MQIAALLTLMGNLSLGNDNITANEKAIFLQYLNLAHLELYQITANFNQDLAEKYEADVAADTSEHDLGFTPYLVNEVWDGTRRLKLKRQSLTTLLARLSETEQSGTPKYYYTAKQAISFVPRSCVPFHFLMHYVPQPVPLTLETLEAAIPYPLAYHPVLVDGALYYLFQEEGGFKNLSKAQDAQKRWEVGQSRLLAYLFTSSGETLTTFSSA